ncbi:unnamed protein product [Litomosoides sigmodontis]|uniref:Uncharacterized protein n=1 Tax=Litomosoides sigmodontis TaxID=42156 RepID=A0A3P6UIS5_LITSI|nr:unnamed protein product [Litomosoides sigmodontis]
MPLFESCCSSSTIDRKKSTAYAPSISELEKEQREDNYQPTSPSTSQHTAKASETLLKLKFNYRDTRCRIDYCIFMINLGAYMVEENIVFLIDDKSACSEMITYWYDLLLSPKQRSSCCSCREANGSEQEASTVRFNEGLSTGSTEMLYATKFYQNCVDEDMESRWMKVYEEQKNVEQTSHGNGEDKQVITGKLSTQSAIEMDRSKFGKSSAFLEKTHSVEAKGGNFRSHLQRCHEMENIDKVTQHG